MHIANNNQLEDMLNGNVTVEVSTTTDNMLELTFFLKSNKSIESFLSNATALKDTVDVAKKRMGFSKVFCRLKFGDLNPSDEVQKDLIALQGKVFDYITVEVKGSQFESSKELLQYARSLKSKPVSAVVDLKESNIKLSQMIHHLVEFKPENIRFAYHKVSSYYDRYIVVRSLLIGKEIRYYAIDCSKRCGLRYDDVDGRDFATPVILKAAYGFVGCCTRYQPAARNKQGKKIGYASPEIYRFNKKTYEYEKIPNKDYRTHRTEDFFNLNKIDLSESAINARPKLKLLLAHLA